MDWTAFWTGVGAFGAVGAVVVAVVVYLRGRSRIVVEIVHHDCLFPPTVVEIFDRLKQAWQYPQPTSDFIESAEPRVRELLQALSNFQNDWRWMDFVRRPDGKMWVCNVINRGHEKAENLELQLPLGMQSLLIHSDNSRDVIAGGTIQIPELRPDESVRILIWSDRLGDGPNCSTPTAGPVCVIRSSSILALPESTAFTAIHEFYL